MGSKKRIGQKLKQNAEYPAILKFLKQCGLKSRTMTATGKAHPFLLIELPDGTELQHSVACTPRGGGCPARGVSHLRRTLAKAGFNVG